MIVKKSEAIKNLKKKARENFGKRNDLLAEPPKGTPVDTRKETAKLANTSQHKVREVDTISPYQPQRGRRARYSQLMR